MPPISDLVRDSKLETTFSDKYTQHVYHVSGATPRQRKVRKEERWQREKHLGTGAFGSVWLEKFVAENGEVQHRAVKEIRKGAQKSKAIDYSRELEAIAKFSHPKYERCFVRSFGWYENDVNVFIAMEYFCYGDLQNYLSAPTSEGEVQEITSQVLEGLSFMHDNGFAHRDLKPNNVLVKSRGPDWWVKIGDFGISKRAEEGLTALRTLSGTLDFLAPEMLAQLGFFDDGDFEISKEYTVAIDIWSLGEIAFRALTGEQAFSIQSMRKYIKGTSSFPIDVLHAHGVSNEGRDFLNSVMAPKPKDRLTAKEALGHKWIEPQRPNSASSTAKMQRSSPTIEEAVPSSEYPIAEASARWSTLNDTMLKLNSLESPASPKESSTIRQLVQKTPITERPGENLKLGGEIGNSGAQASEDDDHNLVHNFIQHSAPISYRPQVNLAITKRWAEAKQISYEGDGWSDEDEDYYEPAPSSARGAQRSGLPAQNAACRTLEGHSLNDTVLKLNSLANPASPKESSAIRQPVQKTSSSPSISERLKENLKLTEDTGNAGAQKSEGDDHTLVNTNVQDPACRTLEGHSDWVFAVAFSPDGRLLASGSSDKTVRLWDPATGAVRGTLKGHSRWGRLWDRATGAAHRTLKGHSDRVWAVAFSPDGRLLASGSRDQTVRLWDPATGAVRRTLEGHSSWVFAVAFSPDGRLLASGSDDKTVRLWDPVTGAVRRTLEGHSSWVRVVAFSPDGRLLASGSRDQTVRLWDPATGAVCRTLKGHSHRVQAVAFSPDGRLLASGSGDKTVRLWDPVTGAVRRTLEGHSSWVYAVAFSPDGRLLASGSGDKTVRLWDPATGAVHRTLEGHSHRVQAVAFSPDGRLLASGSDDATVRIWDIVLDRIKPH